VKGAEDTNLRLNAFADGDDPDLKAAAKAKLEEAK
jgi:hypothetical protein